MQILTAPEVRAWDEFTIRHEPVASIDLMERAAKACFDWLMQSGFIGKNFFLFCGKGNNGGDGLAIARLLFMAGQEVLVYIPDSDSPGTPDFQVNLQKLRELQIPLQFVTSELPAIPIESVIIDALLGTGLNRPLEGWMVAVVNTINASGNTVIAIDIPSGLSSDRSSKGHPAIKATHTLSFQHLKPAFLVVENEAQVGMLHLLHIGLHPAFTETHRPVFTWVTATLAKQLFRPRSPFAHKGHFGHALLVAGSYGKIGAAVLAAKGVLGSGAGLLTVQVPRCGYVVMQTALPEAMTVTDKEEYINTDLEGSLEKYQAIGIGPGLGTDSRSIRVLEKLFDSYRKSVVLDADALNLISNHSQLLSKIPPQSVLTPHPKEFERLFGSVANDFERLDKAREEAAKRNLVIVLKGHHTSVVTPDKCYVNSTGNAAMAKGGSGDVLTGIITALVAQGYDPASAAVLGVYLHGKAADLALAGTGYEAMLATDIVAQLGAAFRTLYS